MVYLEVNLLISIHQLWKVEPDVSVLNVEEDLLVNYKDHIIPVSVITQVVNPPQNITKLCNNRLIAMSYQVRTILHACNVIF